MNIGQIIHIIQIIVTIFCGAEMIVRPFEMRRESKWCQVTYYLLLTVWAGVSIGNSFYFKVSAIQNTLSMIYITIIVMVFYKIPLLVLIVQNGLYWINLSIFEMFFFIINSQDRRSSVQSSIGEAGDWQPLLVIGMCIITVLVIILCVWKRKYQLLGFRYKKIYRMFLFIMIIEYIIRDTYFERERLEKVTNIQLVLDYVYMDIFIMLLIIIVIFLKVLQDARYRDYILLNNNAAILQQYEDMRERMEIKSQQNHDTKQHYLLIHQYLKNNQVEQAIRYLDDLNEELDLPKRHNYCQIPAIDYMLDVKIEKALKDNIHVEVELEACFCPVSDADMCIIIGNLMDNAIEALQDISDNKKIIRFSIDTMNNTFILKVSNAYYGRRKKTNGQYETTKSNKREHGLGLISVDQTVKKMEDRCL